MREGCEVERIWPEELVLLADGRGVAAIPEVDEKQDGKDYGQTPDDGTGDYGYLSGELIASQENSK